MIRKELGASHAEILDYDIDQVQAYAASLGRINAPERQEAPAGAGGKDVEVVSLDHHKAYMAALRARKRRA